MTPEIAVLYEHLHVGNPGDVEFYVEQSDGAQSVLELGAGYGRVLAQLAHLPRAVGLDIDPAIAARSKQPVIIGDMRDFDLDERFDRIFAPYSTMWCLLGDDKRRCFECVKKHLAPGGRFVFDVWAADEMHDTTDAEDRPLEYATTIETDRKWEVYELDRYDQTEQRIDVTYVFEPAFGEPVEQTIRQHYLTSGQLRGLLEACGFSVRLYGDFDKRPFEYDGDRLIVEATADPG